MKLIRFGEAGHERPGLQLADGVRVDASAVGLGMTPAPEYLKAGDVVALGIDASSQKVVVSA